MGKPLRELMGDVATLGRVTNHFERCIRASCEPGAFPVRHLTSAEIKRRFDILEKWFRILRGDKQWGIERTLDALPKALAAELSGLQWEPSDRALWLPGD